MDIKDALKIMLEDPVLLNNKVKVANSLNIPNHQRFQWDHMYSSGNLNSYDYFTQILESWKSAVGSDATFLSLANSMYSAGFKMVAEQLEEFGWENSEQQFAPILFEIDKPVWNFVGRKSELTQLKEQFTKNIRVLVISAMGGMGKTQLSRRLVQILVADGQPSITWLDGDGYNNFCNSFERFANSIKITTQKVGGKNLKLLSLVRKTITILKNLLNWIVIIDNVDEVFEGLEQVVLEITRHPCAFVIMTSRRNDVFSGSVPHIKMIELELNDAKQLCQMTLFNPIQTDSEVTELCIAMQNHPLGLAQSCAYINAQRNEFDESYSISQFLKEIEQNIMRILEYKVELTGYDLTLSSILIMTLDNVCNKYEEGLLAEKCLQFLALINTDQIPVSMVGKLLQCLGVIDEVNIAPMQNRCISLLKKFSLVAVNNSLIKCHRLVNQWVLIGMEKMIYSNENFENETNHLLDVILKNIKTENLSLDELNCITNIWDYAAKNTNIAHLYNIAVCQIGHRFVYLGKYAHYFEIISKQMEITNKVYAGSDRNTIDLSFEYCNALRWIGEDDDALDNLTLFIKNNVKDIPNVPVVMLTMVEILLGKDRYTESITFGKKAFLASIESANTVTDRNVILSVARLASAYNRCGKLKALNLFEILVTLCGNDELQSFKVFDKLAVASTYALFNKLDDAKRMYNDCLDFCVREFGENHVYSVFAKHEYAKCLMEMGMYDAARSHFKDLSEKLQDDHMIVRYITSAKMYLK